MKKTLLILFILIPAMIAASVFLLPNRAVSELENRSLTTKNTLSGDVLGGRFQTDLENLLSDQFPLRNGLAYLQAALRFALGQREIGGAYICKDGRLIQKITRADVNETALCLYADKIDRLARERKTYVMYVPSAGAALKDALPKGAPMYDVDALYSALAARLPNAVAVDLRGVLTSPECYYKTDHHWTAYGAYLAYAAFCNAAGAAARPIESFALQTVSEDFRGTLFSKVPISKAVDEIQLPQVPALKVSADGNNIDFYAFDALETTNGYQVFQGGNHGVVEIENEI